MITNLGEKAHWSKNVILVDADYADRVAFNLIVNFERMIGRRIPQADMAKWLECVALDGGLRPGNHETQVVLIHQPQQSAMQNFAPADYAQELHEKAFQGELGEFVIGAYERPAEGQTGEDFLVEALRMVCTQQEVERVMVIPDTESPAVLQQVREVLRQTDDGSKHITLFSMQPVTGGAFRQEILGYSLMAALGISSAEIEEKVRK